MQYELLPRPLVKQIRELLERAGSKGISLGSVLDDLQTHCRSGGQHLLERLQARQIELASTEAETYINQKELNHIQFLRDHIDHGLGYAEEAALYLKYIERNQYSYVGLSDYVMENSRYERM